MTAGQHISEHDRALWNEFVLQSRAAALDNRPEPLADEDLLVLAAYLDGRLDEWEMSRLEQRLIDEPVLLDTLMAAHAARDAAATAPQPVIAYALNSYPSAAPSSARAQPAPQVPVRRRAFGAPAMAWSVAALLILTFCTIGAYVALDGREPMTAETPRRSSDPLAEDIGRRNDSVFGDPARAYFDGTEVED